MSQRSLHSRPTARDVVVGHLRPLIIRGELIPGARISVPDLAESLGVSHTPAREALQLLEAEGLVRSDPFRGARVAELSVDDCQELYLMRGALERLAARLGTEAITDDDLERMTALLQTMTTAAHAGDADSFIQADWAFHEIHYRASGRTTLWERILMLRRTCERYTRNSYVSEPGRLVDNAASHRDLFGHIRSRDAGASESWITTVLDDAESAAHAAIVAAQQPSATSAARPSMP